jgi:uncharacterized membrane-anchored protein
LPTAGSSKKENNMINKKIAWICFALLVLLQLWVPASMIYNREAVLKNGNAFKFRLAPVDPNDPFRGKYIILRFEENIYREKNGIKWMDVKTAYAQLTTDSAGYAGILSLHKKKPAGSADYIKVNISSSNSDTSNEVFVEWPFDRYYMEETKAAAAEQVYIKSTADSSNKTYALVKVKDGDAVLENVFINNKPIASYLKK